MSRPRSGRVELSGTLVAITALHVGGAGGGMGIDLQVARDGAGRVVLPGTSLAGVIRSWVGQELDVSDKQMSLAFGCTPPRGGYRSTPVADRAAASLFMVDDAPAIDHVGIEIRDHVGIDRRTGTAATGIKYDRQVVPSSTRFEFRLQLDLPNDTTDASACRAVIAHIAKALVDGEIRIGAASTRGLGRVQLLAPQVRSFDFKGTAGLIDFLDHLNPDASTEGTFSEEALEAWRTHLLRKPRRSHHVTIHWTAVTPVIVHDAEPGDAVDHFPLTTAVRAKDGSTKLHLALPGSSIKGVLRTHAERIMRTVLELPDTPIADGSVSWLDQLNVPLAQDWFGSARPPSRHPDEPDVVNSNADPDQSDNDDPMPTSAAGSLEVADCLATSPAIGPKAWANLRALPKPDKESDVHSVADALGAAGLDGWRVAHHVAIDRWTGGAAPGLLFSNLEPAEVQWAPMEITLRPWRTATATDEAYKAGIALVALVLSQLVAGWARFGHGVSMGHGEIAVTKLVIDGKEVPVEGDEVIDAVITTLGHNPPDVRQAWTSWIAKQAAAMEEAAPQ